MITRGIATTLVSGALLLGPNSPAQAAPAIVGQPAPEFALTDTRGKAWTLSSLHGQWVVLEWSNHECPFVRRQYTSGAMQRAQEGWTTIRSPKSIGESLRAAVTDYEIVQLA